MNFHFSELNNQWEDIYNSISHKLENTKKNLLGLTFLKPSSSAIDISWLMANCKEIHDSLILIMNEGEIELTEEQIIKLFYNSSVKYILRRYIGYYPGYNTNIPKLALSIFAVAYAVIIIEKREDFGSVYLKPSIDDISTKFIDILKDIDKNIDGTNVLRANLIEDIYMEFDFEKFGFIISQK